LVAPCFSGGEKGGRIVGGVRVVADEVGGGVAQRALLQFGHQRAEVVAGLDEVVVIFGGGVGALVGGGPVVADCRLAYPVQVHGVADQRVLRRHQRLRGAGGPVSRGPVLGLLVDVGLLGDFGHPHEHAAPGLHCLRHRDIDTTLTLPVDHQDLALVTGGIKDLLQLGFPVGSPPRHPVGVDRLDRLPRHPLAHQRLHLPVDQIVAVTQDLLGPAAAALPPPVRLFGDSAQLGAGVLHQIGGALHQPLLLRPIDLMRVCQAIDLVQHGIQVRQGARCAGDLIEEPAPLAVDLDGGDASGVLGVSAHHDLMSLGAHPDGLGSPDLFGFDGLGQARFAGLGAPP
jgi:hypothetical protein